MTNPFDLLAPEAAAPAPNFTGSYDAGIYYDLTNEQYHRSSGISKSGLDLIDVSPSYFKWNQQAPRNDDKTKALDMGTALHCILLEPDEYSSRFVISPEFNRRTVAGRKEEAEYLASIGDDVTVLTPDEDKQLKLMRDSAMAHPVAKYIFDCEGYNESSIYWNDSETGELCKVRPDRFIKVGGRHTLIDVKKVDQMERFKRHVFEFRYHVQNAMYRRGFQAHFNELPDFWFLAVSSSVSAGRYPVNVFHLPHDVVEEGDRLFRENLNTYHACKQANDWLHLSSI